MFACVNPGLIKPINHIHENPNPSSDKLCFHLLGVAVLLSPLPPPTRYPNAQFDHAIVNNMDILHT